MANEAILAIDDDPISLRFMQTLLSRDGYVVRTATDLGEATMLLGVFQPDLVLCDTDFASSSFGQFVDRLRSRRPRGRVPIIAVAAATDDTRRSAIAAGSDAYIPKPFAPSALLTIVTRRLARTLGREGSAI